VTTTSTKTTSKTTSHGCDMRHDPIIAEAIGTIVDRVGEHSKAITDARPAEPGLVASYDDVMASAAKVKGRGLLYPYIGSGLGNGPLVELGDGSVKWDMICGIGVHFFGHSHPEMVRAALQAGTEDTIKHGNLQSGSAAYEFGAKLVELASRSSRLRQAFVTTSGAVANESALKVCYQKHAPASRVIAFSNCFMGRTVTMAQIGDSHAGRDGLPLSTQVDYIPFWTEEAVQLAGGETKFIDQCVAQLEEYATRYPKLHACFIFELVQGEGGFNTAPREFFTALMDCCRRHDIAIWDDEIQSFGRTERMFAYEMYDLGDYVDVFCVGKMTQACATLYTDDYSPRPGLLSGTFTGATADFTGGLRVLEMLEAGNHYGPDGSFAHHHKLFCEHVAALAAKHPDWFPQLPTGESLSGGVGGMMKFTPFGGDKAKVSAACRACFDEGLIVFYCGHGPFHIRMLPPMPVMEDSYWPRIFECLERGLAKVAG